MAEQIEKDLDEKIEAMENHVVRDLRSAIRSNLDNDRKINNWLTRHSDVAVRRSLNIAELHQQLLHERTKSADVELFIVGGALVPIRGVNFRLVSGWDLSPTCHQQWLQNRSSRFTCKHFFRLVRIMNRHQSKVLRVNWGPESRRTVSSRDLQTRTDHKLNSMDIFGPSIPGFKFKGWFSCRLGRR